MRLEEGRREAGIADLEMARTLDPTDGALQNDIGWEYLDVDEAERAAGAFQAADAAFKDADNYRGLGRAYATLSRHSDAVAAFDAGLKIARDDQRDDLSFELGFSYTAVGNCQQAFQVLGKRRTLGVTLKAIDAGLEVVGVRKGGPADLAGVARGGVLTEFAGRSLRRVSSSDFVDKILSKVPFASRTTMRLLRNGGPLEVVTVTGVVPDLPKLASQKEPQKKRPRYE